MFGLQSVKGEHVRQDRTAGHAGDEVGDRVAAPLRVEQIHHHHGERVVDGGKIVGGAGHQEQPHREPLQDRGGSAHVLRGKAAVLSSQRMVPTYTGDQKYDQESVQVLLYISIYIAGRVIGTTVTIHPSISRSVYRRSTYSEETAFSIPPVRNKFPPDLFLEHLDLWLGTSCLYFFEIPNNLN